MITVANLTEKKAEFFAYVLSLNSNLSEELVNELFETCLNECEWHEYKETFDTIESIAYYFYQDLGYKSLGVIEKGLRGIMGAREERASQNGERYNKFTKEYEKI